MQSPSPNKSTAAVCQTTPLYRLPGYSKNKLAYCPLPTGSPQELLHTFQSAPQFSAVQTADLLSDENLRVLLFGSDSYYLRQAAAYLSAIHAGMKTDHQSANHNTFWDDLNLGEYSIEDDTDSTTASLIEKNLTVVSPVLLDPEIAAFLQQGQLSSTTNDMKKMEILVLDELNTTAILIAADSGAVLTDDVLQQIESTLEKDRHMDFFIAVKPEQEDLDLLEELRFTYGFRECQIGQADQPYLRRMLAETADNLLIPLDENIDLDQAILQLRRYRGSRFTEADLHTLLSHAASKNTPLKTEDLLFSPRKAIQNNRGLEQLNRMIGLDTIKGALRRLLATAALEDRRRMHGIDISPSCRNMAFSGPPGTGKSVTARLVAQIMREEGSGSGRFVEAGREQLIGAYLGQTSPMISKLFQQAKGGVLFIDEAGALLNEGGRDIYATEAVNALVRHMELEPETIVIFATYPEEMQKLLSSNPGLSSRVAQVLDFKEYNNDELFHIFCDFAEKELLTVAKEAISICNDFFSELKVRKGENFGNGREARRLYQAAKEELALRTMDSSQTTWKLTKKDLQIAADRLLLQENDTQTHQIGFTAY